MGHGETHRDDEAGSLAVPAGQEGPELLTELVRRLDSASIPIVALELRRPSLDDVFLSLTGRASTEEPGTPSESGTAAETPAADESTIKEPV
jgi:ABC-2 type transport system ATP-binding protein